MELFIAGAAANMAATAFMWNRIVLLFWVDCGSAGWRRGRPAPAECRADSKTAGCLSDPQPRRPHRGAAVAGAAGVSGAGLCYAAYSDPTALFLESYPNAGKSLPLQRLRLCAGTARPAGHMGAFRARAGSVWLRFEWNGKSILFSGDYAEHSPLYPCDRAEPDGRSGRSGMRLTAARTQTGTLASKNSVWRPCSA